MGANIAGIYGAQIFRADDNPRYRRAFAVAAAVLAFGLVVAVVRYVDDKVRMRRKVQQVDDDSFSDGETPTFLPTDDQPAPIFDGRRPSLTTGKP